MSTASPLILIIEDELEIASVVSAYFEREGFRTVSASTGETGLDHHLRLTPDIVILDVKLPKKDGFAVLSRIRERGDTPVIMATALGDDLEKLSAFKVGVDDYVVKPFNPLELVARAKSILRRGGVRQQNTLRFGPIEVDLEGHVARVSNENETTLDLTQTEFKLLAHMVRWPRRAFTRQDLLDACMADRDAIERTVDSHISNLRRKLAAAGADDLISGVRSVGYKLAKD